MAFHGFFTAFSRVVHGRFTDFSRSRFCGKFQVGTFTRSYSVLYLVTSWSKMQTFVQSPCSQAHFTCIELNQIAFLSTYLLTMISQHDMWASWTKYVYNGYKHSYKKEHLPRARLNLAVSKDQVKLGRGRAGFPVDFPLNQSIDSCFIVFLHPSPMFTRPLTWRSDCQHGCMPQRTRANLSGLAAPWGMTHDLWSPWESHEKRRFDIGIKWEKYGKMPLKWAFLGCTKWKIMGKSWEIRRKWSFIPGKSFNFCWGTVQACDWFHSKAPWPYSKGCYSALQRSEAIWLRTSNKMHWGSPKWKILVIF